MNKLTTIDQKRNWKIDSVSFARIDKLTATDLYKTIEALNDPKRNWKRESISFSRIDKLINNNLDSFFSVSKHYKIKRKFESLLNLSERIKMEFNNLLGVTLAFSIQGIANEVLNDGVHRHPSLPTEIIELIVYYILLSNLNYGKNIDPGYLNDLINTYPKNSALIWRGFKLNVDNALIKLFELYDFSCCLLHISNEDMVDFIIDHKHQLSDANLVGYMHRGEILYKLAYQCSHLRSLKFSLKKEYFGELELSCIGNFTSLKILDISSEYQIPSLSLALEKLTSLTQLRIAPFLDVYLTAVEKMTELKSLYFDADNIISERDFSPVFEKLTSVTDLGLVRNACRGSELIKVIGKMNSLVSLRLIQNDNIPEIDLLEALKKLTQLKILNVNNSTMTLQKLPLAIVKMKNLQKLYMDNIRNNDIRLNDLIDVLKKLPSLSYISADKEILEILRQQLKNIFK